MDEQRSESAQIPEKKEASVFTCSSCGGDLVFDPRDQVLKCPFCGAVQQIAVEMKEIEDRDLESAATGANVNWGSVKKVFRCNNCGAESIIDGNSTVQSCAFCGSTRIVSYEEAAGIAPDGLVPFKIAKQVAENNFKEWIGKRRFAPGALKTTYRKQSLSGAYIPYWAYSCETDSNYSAEAGMHYYENEMRPVKRDGKTQMEERRVRKTSWSQTRGSFRERFRNVLINASKQLKSSVISSVEPFKLDELVPYAPGFLAGFLAEKYSITLDDGWEEARKKIDRDIESAVKKQIKADEIRGLFVDTRYDSRRYKHLLLPVWISSYTFKDKIYHFMVNGQTGKVSGEAPVSAGKVIGLIAAIAAVIAIIVMLVR